MLTPPSVSSAPASARPSDGSAVDLRERDVGLLVGRLEAVDDRAALDGDAAADRVDAGVRAASSAGASAARAAPRRRASRSRPRRRSRSAPGAGARGRRAPPRAAHAGTRRLSRHGDSPVSSTRIDDLARPRVAGDDAQPHVAGADRARHELVDLHAAVVGGGDVAGEAGERARHVGRAAGDVEPRRAQARGGARVLGVRVRRLARHALVQRVGVEEAAAVERRRGGDDVEERPLGEVGVAHVAGGQQQPPRELDGGDAGAGLRVGAVGRQLEVLAEGLVGVARAHAAGQVGAPLDRALPLAHDRLQQLGVAGLDGDVDGAARQVQRAYGVAAEGVRLADRHVVLEVRAAALDVGQRRPAAALDEQPRLLEVALLAGRPVQLDQRHLDLRVPADALVAVGAERLAHVVGRAARDLGQPVRRRACAGARRRPGSCGRSSRARGPTRGRCSGARARGGRSGC